MTNNNEITKEDAKNVLFLHGWGCDGSIWQGVISQLGAYNTYSPDLRGFGAAADTPSGGWCVEDYAADIARYIREKGIAPCVVVGHSFGGRIAFTLAANYPTMVSKLVLTASAGLRRFSLIRVVKVMLYKVAKFAVKCRLLPPKSLKKFGSTDFKALTSPLRETFALVVRQQGAKTCRRVTQPTLLIWGDCDCDTPLWIAKRMRRLIRHSRLQVFKGYSHYLFLQDPTRFTDAITRFVDS